MLSKIASFRHFHSSIGSSICVCVFVGVFQIVFGGKRIAMKDRQFFSELIHLQCTKFQK